MTKQEALSEAIVHLGATEALLRDIILPADIDNDRPGQGPAITLAHCRWRAIRHAVHSARSHLANELEEEGHDGSNQELRPAG